MAALAMKNSVLAMTILFLPTLSFAAPAQSVKFKTRDGVQLIGTFVAPEKGSPTLIMVHGMAAVKEEWNPLISSLTAHGWGSLAYDMRGHGESSLTKDVLGSPNGYTAFGDPGPGTQWERMIDDVSAAIRFLEDKKNIKRDKMVLAGASIGANIVLNYQALTGAGRSVVLLSPGINYREFKTRDAMKTVSVPVLIVASRADQYAFLSSQELAHDKSNVVFWQDVKPGHGVQMFDDKLVARIIEWLSKN